MFVDNLDELNWMDEESKKKAQEKVGKPQPVLYPQGSSYGQDPLLEVQPRWEGHWNWGHAWVIPRKQKGALRSEARTYPSSSGASDKSVT